MVYVNEEEKRSEGSFRSDEVVFSQVEPGRPSPSTPGAFAISSGCAADENALFKHGVSPTSVFSKEDDGDEESVPSSHIGDVRDVDPRDNSDGSPRNSSSRFGVRSRWAATPKETRKKYALLTLVGVLFIVVIAMAVAMAVGAAKGRAMEEQYGQYASMKGPPPGVDISQYTAEGGGGGGPPPGVDIEGYEGQEGPPPGVVIPEDNEGQEGTPLGVDISEYTGEGPPPGVMEGNDNDGADGQQQEEEGPPAWVNVEDYEGQDGPPAWVDTEGSSSGVGDGQQGMSNWLQGMIGAFTQGSGGQDEEQEESTTTTTTTPPPTSSPTSKMQTDNDIEGVGDDSTEDELDTWSAIVADGACFDGFAEIWCCATGYCSDSLRQAP